MLQRHHSQNKATRYKTTPNLFSRSRARSLSPLFFLFDLLYFSMVEIIALLRLSSFSNNSVLVCMHIRGNTIWLTASLWYANLMETTVNQMPTPSNRHVATFTSLQTIRFLVVFQQDFRSLYSIFFLLVIQASIYFPIQILCPLSCSVPLWITSSNRLIICVQCQ